MHTQYYTHWVWSSKWVSVLGWVAEKGVELYYTVEQAWGLHRLSLLRVFHPIIFTHSLRTTYCVHTLRNQVPLPRQPGEVLSQKLWALTSYQLPSCQGPRLVVLCQRRVSSVAVKLEPCLCHLVFSEANCKSPAVARGAFRDFKRDCFAD